jgi:hypothetical protein
MTKRYDVIYQLPARSIQNVYDGYAIVKTIEAESLEDVFEKMQGENWSPNGEARELILSLGLTHTSMMVGDVIYDIVENKYWSVEWSGFSELSIDNI